MDALFGDATSAMPTPTVRAETGSLLSVASPVPSVDLRRGVAGPAYGNGIGASSAIPGLDIDPPHVAIVKGKPQYTAAAADEGSEGVGGWISRMRRQADGGSVRSGKSGQQYRPVDQEDE
jgi:hypothetical protein